MKHFKIVTFVVACLSINTVTHAAEISACESAECVSYFKKYKKYAKAGHARAMVTLGELYYHGYGVDKSLKKALRQFRRAAKYGSILGQAKAGLVYLTEPEFLDKDEGLKYLKKAARNKDGGSAFLLGIIYNDKEYGFYDPQESDKWLSKAYRYRNREVRSYIEKIRFDKDFTANNFPKVSKLIATLATSSKEVQPNDLVASTDTKPVSAILWPEDESMEVITVSPPTLIEIFDEELADLKNAYPEKYAVGTGTNIIGRSCEHMVSCNVTSKADFERLLDSMDGIL